MKDPRPELLREIDAFLKKKDMTESRFGREVKKNSSLVQRIRKGGPVSLDTLLACDAYIKSHK